MTRWAKVFQEKEKMLYWAYGSNLNVRQMKIRCPKAKYLGPMDVQDAALVFRHVADVEVRPGSLVPGGLWLITPECEAVLDRYEGYRSNAPQQGLYDKRYFKVRRHKQVKPCLFYQMTRANARSQMPPSEGYLRTIVRGYHDFGMADKLLVLQAALDESWSGRASHYLVERWRDRGSPQLAQDMLPSRKVEPKYRKGSMEDRLGLAAE